MFGSKATDAAQTRKSIRKVSHELEMLAYAKGMMSSRNKASAVSVRLSRAAGFNYDNYVYAVNMFRELVSRFQGRLFVLSNRDLVFGYQGAPGEPAVKDAVYKIRLLFNVGGDDVGGPFAEWYDLELDADRFADYAQKLLDRYRPAAAATAEPAHDDAAARDEAAAHEESDAEIEAAAPADRAPADALADFTRLLSTIDLAPLLRRQPIYRVLPGRAPQAVVHELYVSISDLESKLPPGTRLAADRYLFQYAMHALDKSVLGFMRQQMRLLPASNFTLNANVATLLSKEFVDFDGVLSAEQRSNIMLELPAVDVMGDLSTFLAIAEEVRHKGYRLCLDGLSPFTMPYFRLQDLNFDLFKMAWSPELVEERDAQQRTLLSGVVERCGADRIILYHCDSEHAISFGQELGISLYQGRHLDQAAKG